VESRLTGPVAVKDYVNVDVNVDVNDQTHLGWFDVRS
jgi:hypothetical protein